MKTKFLSSLFAIIGIFQISHSKVEATNIKPPQDILAGIWKYQNGKEAFVVNFFRVADGYKGHYKKIMVDADGNQVAEIYNSDKPIGNTTTNWPYVIYSGDISNNYEIRAIIHDNTVTTAPNAGGFINGVLDMKILNPNCYTPPNNSCPLQASWTVKKDAGLQNPDEPNFSIPTNIVLTKQ
jgi:hypothetical protein